MVSTWSWRASASPTEKRILLTGLDEYQKRSIANDPEAARSFLSSRRIARDGRTGCCANWRPYAAIASLILNLDETITKE